MRIRKVASSPRHRSFSEYGGVTAKLLHQSNRLVIAEQQGNGAASPGPEQPAGTTSQVGTDRGHGLIVSPVAGPLDHKPRATILACGSPRRTRRDQASTRQARVHPGPDLSGRSGIATRRGQHGIRRAIPREVIKIERARSAFSERTSIPTSAMG